MNKYSADLIDEQGFLDQSFYYDTIEECQKRYDDLKQENINSIGMTLQLWERETEDNPVCLLEETIK